MKYPAEAWNDTIYTKKDIRYYDCVIRKDGRVVFPRPLNMHPALADEIARVFAMLRAVNLQNVVMNMWT